MYIDLKIIEKSFQLYEGQIVLILFQITKGHFVLSRPFFVCDFQSSGHTVLAFVTGGVPVLACTLVYARFYSWADSPGPHLLFINA